MTTSNLTPKEFGRRFRKALSVPFLLNQVCSTSVKDFVTSYAGSLGCSEKCLFFPFLSCAATCMGTESCIELTAGWQEPPIIWTLVITPVSLHRVDVAEHLKLQLLEIQNEAFFVEKPDETKDFIKEEEINCMDMNDSKEEDTFEEDVIDKDSKDEDTEEVNRKEENTTEDGANKDITNEENEKEENEKGEKEKEENEKEENEKENQRKDENMKNENTKDEDMKDDDMKDEDMKDEDTLQDDTIQDDTIQDDTIQDDTIQDDTIDEDAKDEDTKNMTNIEDIKIEITKFEDIKIEITKTEEARHLPKFVLDMFTFDQLHDMLKLSHGHGLGLYNSVRVLNNIMMLPHEAEIMLRLHAGAGWFSDSHVEESTLTKTRVNFAILSTPSTVHQALTVAPNFQELFQQCFLTACAEENHVKFSQLSSASSQTGQLKSIFQSLIKLHCSGTPIIYKLSPEANEKFEQIHDELTDKARQMVRKNAHKVFHPALSYLGRLSCVLHALDNIIEAVSWNLPLDPSTWNTEISAATVWQARELLGHIIEQRHALMEQTTIEPSAPSQQKNNMRSPQTTDIDLVDVQPTNVMQSPRTPRTPIAAQRANLTPISAQRTNSTPITAQRANLNYPISPNVMPTRTQNQGTYQRSYYNNNARRNIMTRSRVNTRSFDSLLNNTVNGGDPRIVSIHSAGLPVANNEPAFNPIITGCGSIGSTSSSRNLRQDLNLPPSLSVSVAESNLPPPLLSRVPQSDILLQATQSAHLDIPNEEFFTSFRVSLRKLLMHGVPEISPSRCVQLRLTPDPNFDGLGDPAKQQYTPSFARTFLKKLESLGFGICEGPTANNMRHFLFKKRNFKALGEQPRRWLIELKISERDYDKCFSSVGKTAAQNGSIVCLE